MPYYLLLSRSITHAQRMQSVLERNGIASRVFRPPVGLTDKGCSYAVKVAERDFLMAVFRLREETLLPTRVFLTVGDGAFREVYP